MDRTAIAPFLVDLRFAFLECGKRVLHAFSGAFGQQLTEATVPPVVF